MKKEYRKKGLRTPPDAHSIGKANMDDDLRRRKDTSF